MKTIRAYWSHQSPYCYFALDRLLALNARPDTSVELCPVLPGVIRDGTLFADRDPIEERYFLLDVARTAEFLGLPYAEANPYPVNFAPGTMYRAAADQPRVFELYNLTAAAIDIGRGWAFLDVVTRLIWDGRTPGWDQDGKFDAALTSAGFDCRALRRSADQNRLRFEQSFTINRQRMLAAGHWGVPMFEFDGEPFYGQDRFDQLLWRINES